MVSKAKEEMTAMFSRLIFALVLVSLFISCATPPSKTPSETSKPLPARAPDLDKGVAALIDGDYDTALHELRPLAERGAPSAQYHLGRMHQQGWGVPKNEASGARLIRKAAEKGYAEAKFDLGTDYMMGSGVAKDPTEATKWLHRAAKQGYSAAQFAIGLMYGIGRGVPRDLMQSAKWVRKAAEQEVAEAQLHLGAMYEKGHGVPQDHAQVAKWYRKAADGYHKLVELEEVWKWGFIQFKLGVMYQKGQGVPRDLVQAHMWFSLAAANGDEDGSQSMETVAKKMSPAQIAVAAKLARQLLAKHKKK
jgi:TPR repeat protein